MTVETFAALIALVAVCGGVVIIAALCLIAKRADHQQSPVWLSPQQQTALAWLNNRYAGDVTITDCPAHGDRAVRLSVWIDGEVEGFWVVDRDGLVVVSAGLDDAAADLYDRSRTR